MNLILGIFYYGILDIMLFNFSFSLMAIVDKRAARVFLVLSTTGHLSLFPLLFQSQGKLILISEKLEH